MLSVQLFNQINARKINDELNVFSGIIHSHLFIYIWIVEAGLQVQDPIFSFNHGSRTSYARPL